MNRWEFNTAMSQSDIIWENYTSDSIFGSTKTVFLWIILLLISVAFVTPVLLRDYWNRLETKMNLEYKLFS